MSNKLKKQIGIIVVSTALIIPSLCFPFAPALFGAFELLNTVGGVTLTNSLMASTISIGGIITGLDYYYCSDLILACKDKVFIPDSSAATMPIKVILKPAESRKNPNPKLYDPDPAKRDVKPKQSIPSPDQPTQTIPTSWTTLHNAFGGEGEGNFKEISSTSSTYRRVKEIMFRAGETAPTQIIDTDGSSAIMSSQWTYNYPSNDQQNPSGKSVMYTRSAKLTCPQGYSLMAGACELVVASDVKKPSAVPCELLITNGEWDYDKQNPNCNGMKERLSAKNAGQITTFAQDAAGKVNARSASVEGYGLKFCEDDGEGSEMRCIQTSGFNADKGGYEIQKIDTYPGGTLSNTVDPNINKEPGKGTGGGGSCGGPGQAACAIDDSGFGGKTVTDKTGEELGKAKDEYSNRVANGQGDHGISSSGILGDSAFRPKAVCEELSIDFGNFGVMQSNFLLNLDICDNPVINLGRLFLSWAMYSATLFYVWRKLTGSEGSISEVGK